MTALQRNFVFLQKPEHRLRKPSGSLRSTGAGGSMGGRVGSIEMTSDSGLSSNLEGWKPLQLAAHAMMVEVVVLYARWES
jgi:hypothetical protein